MLQKFNITPYAIILFFFGLTLIPVSLAPPMAAAAEEVCLPNERITKMKDTAKHNDYMYSVDKCASQPQGGCEAGWGNNRCAMSSAADTVCCAR